MDTSDCYFNEAEKNILACDLGYANPLFVGYLTRLL